MTSSVRDRDVIGRLHDVDLFCVAERKDFFGSGANDLAIVLVGHLEERDLAIDEPVGQHHGMVVLVQRSSGNEAEQPRLGAVSEWQSGGQVVKGRLTNCKRHRRNSKHTKLFANIKDLIKIKIQVTKAHVPRIVVKTNANDRTRLSIV